MTAMSHHKSTSESKSDWPTATLRERISVGLCLTPFQRKLLQKNLQSDLPQQYRQRIEIMLLADLGKSQVQICKALGCCAATVRHWIFMARMGQAHNWNDHPIGRPKAVNDHYLARLRELVSRSPKEFGYAFERWTGGWLSKHLAKELGIKITPQHVNRLLKQMGLSTKGKPIQENESTNLNHPSNRIAIRDLDALEVSDLKSAHFQSL